MIYHPFNPHAGAARAGAATTAAEKRNRKFTFNLYCFVQSLIIHGNTTE